MQFINIIPFPILNLMKLGYFVKAELNKEVETCRQNIQKKHWNMIVGTYDEKQKIVLQCFNASENADFIKIGNSTGQFFEIAPGNDLAVHGDALDNGTYAYVDLQDWYVVAVSGNQTGNILYLERY